MRKWLKAPLEWWKAEYRKDGKSGMMQHDTGPHAATRHDSGASQAG